MCSQNRHLHDWFAQAAPVYPEWLSIAQVPFVGKTSVEGDLLLAGDAAGMIAPLAGDGMAMALHSGKLAALLIDRYLAAELTAPELKKTYVRTWNATFSARLRLGRVLQSSCCALPCSPLDYGFSTYFQLGRFSFGSDSGFDFSGALDR